jgi:hypothetical protein
MIGKGSPFGARFSGPLLEIVFFVKASAVLSELVDRGESERVSGISSSFTPKGRIAEIGSHRAGGDGWRRPDQPERTLDASRQIG